MKLSHIRKYFIPAFQKANVVGDLQVMVAGKLTYKYCNAKQKGFWKRFINEKDLFVWNKTTGDQYMISIYKDANPMIICETLDEYVNDPFYKAIKKLQQKTNPSFKIDAALEYVAEKDEFYRLDGFNMKHFKIGDVISLPVSYFETWKKEFRDSWRCNEKLYSARFGSWENFWNGKIKEDINKFIYSRNIKNFTIGETWKR